MKKNVQIGEKYLVEIEDYLHREGFKKLTEAEVFLPEWKYSIESCRQIIKERSKDEISVL